MKNISFALLSLIVGSALSFAAETLRPGEAAKIGVDPAYMTWGQVNALVKRGCELGAMVSHNPVRFVTGQCDWICPPHTVYAAYNACPSPDKAIELTTGNHGDPGNVGSYYRWLAE